ncbi:PKD domain-containing protein [Sabulibacter ruber]|uniref:PKD domain-containing protein n=1 Tax=Sabulibacter ruber TaxID=2811901 RepID=UPI001A961EF0|nr:PKD domain-containing protein [Sabulibacter ruber]
MFPLRKIFLLLLPAMLLFSACEDKEDNEDPMPNTLVANAGPDQQVEFIRTVTLDGSASEDSENQPLTYSWSFTKKPANSNAALTGANTVEATFMPDQPGEYEAELTVSNGKVSVKDKVLVTVTSSAMVLQDIDVKTVLENRIADPNLPDYLVNDDIGVNAELTVKPGVVIAFAEDVSMSVNGNGGVLIAKGEATNKIKFTGKTAQKGYWTGIMFYSNSSLNEFSHAEVVYGGSEDLMSDARANIVVTEDARLTIKNTTISQSGGHGLYLAEGSILVGFANNTLSHNAEAPLKLAANNVPVLDAASVFTSSNARNVIEVMRSSVEGNNEVVWPAFNDNTPYRFLGFIGVHAGWRLTPGITIEVAEDQQFDIGDGYLHAVGTPEKKITFTGVSKTTGSWNGIMIYTRSASNRMEHVQISYAGGADIISGVKTSVVVSHGGSLTMKNSVISHSGGYGVYLNGRDVTFNADMETANTFTSNALAPVFHNVSH